MWMHRFSIMIIICVGLFLHDTLRANLAAAEWARVGGTHKYDRYVDMTTIGVSGQRVTLWTLRDFRIERAIPRGPYRSLTIKRQYDCRQRYGATMYVAGAELCVDDSLYRRRVAVWSNDDFCS